MESSADGPTIQGGLPGAYRQRNDDSTIDPTFVRRNRIVADSECRTENETTLDTFELEPSAGAALFVQAFESLLPKFMALLPGDIIKVNLSIPAAVATALGVQPRLLDMKDRIAESVPPVERDLPEKLSDYALALSHAHTLYVMATRANDLVPALSDEGVKLRTLLLADAQVLIHRGIVNPEALRAYKGSVGYKNLASDLLLLAQVFRSRPEPDREWSAVRAAELQRANELAAAILKVLWKRTMPDPDVEAAADMRNRAFTVFKRSYDQLRRAVISLRWNERDANELVPSLYVKHRRVRPRAARS